MTDFSFFHLLFCCDTFLEVVLYFFFPLWFICPLIQYLLCNRFHHSQEFSKPDKGTALIFNYHSLWFHSNAFQFFSKFAIGKKTEKRQRKNSLFFVKRYGRCQYSFPEVRIYILQFPKVGLWEVEQKSYPNNTFKPWRSFIFYSFWKMARVYFFKAMKEKLTFYLYSWTWKLLPRAGGDHCGSWKRPLDKDGGRVRETTFLSPPNCYCDLRRMCNKDSRC